MRHPRSVLLAACLALGLGVASLAGPALGRVPLAGPPAATAVPALASSKGKYRDLLHTLNVSGDRNIYGDFHDWGFWSGTAYAGHDDLKPGYWVYVHPNWYVWKNVTDFPDTETQSTGRSWGPEQATGAPDTLEAGDIRTAWASLTQDEQDEWLELRYPEAVRPAGVLVHETFNPGALVRVSAYGPDGKELTVWTGRDPLEPNSGRGVAIIPFRTDFPVERVRVYLDSKSVAGWNEIDAVGLLDEFGRTQWARSATASSTYAEQ